MNHFYRKLAMTNLKNNKQFYFPYLLAGIASAMMFYIMCAMHKNEGVYTMRGASGLYIVLSMGLVIVGLCVCIFLFYTNSFVMKRRKKELGVYNILGMEKKHLIKIMAWEAVLLYLASVIGGLISGVVFHKLAAMFLYHLSGLPKSVPFSISVSGCLQTAFLFAAIYLAMLLYNFLQVKLSNPIELLHGTTMGEREPKTKWLSALAGIICILAGYYLAITVHGILEAVNMFFVAVILVIVGTYLLFMAVSIAFLKLLKRNKTYYYKTSHFISISGMLYRMKRNAVGLATICILSTMVLVMISTTVCMYAGLEDSLQQQYSKEISSIVYFSNIPDDATRAKFLEQYQSLAKQQNRTITDSKEYVSLDLTAHMTENTVERFDNDNASYNYRDMTLLSVMTKADYEKYTGEEIAEIAQGNVAVASSAKFPWNTINMAEQEYPIAQKPDFPDKNTQDFLGSIHAVYMIVADSNALSSIQTTCAAFSDTEKPVQYKIALDIDGSSDEKKAYASAVREMLQTQSAQTDFEAGITYCRTEQREDYMQMNGGLLFLGLFLGSMFLMITVLIIYYKQISEGFEDRERFAIMTKVGLSHNMVKAAIRTQVRTVFFLPITVAVIHLAAAFPMLKLMLLIFGLNNTPLFAVCLAITAAVFAVIYFIVFQLTSKSYYKIVYR